MSCMFEENNDTTHNIKICVFFQRVKMILNAEKKTICSDHKMYEHFLNLSIVLANHEHMYNNRYLVKRNDMNITAFEIPPIN